MKLKLNLKAQFLLPSLLIIVIGMSLAAFLSYNASAGAIKGIVRSQLIQITDSLTMQINEWLDSLDRDVLVLSKNRDFADILKNQDDAQAKQRVQDELNLFLKTFKSFESVGIANPAGLTIASTDTKSINKLEIADRSYFKDSIGGESSISEVIVSRISGNPTFVVSAPIYEREKVTGVLFATVDLLAFNGKFVDPIKVGEKGYAYAMQNDGKIIAYPIREQILKLDLSDFDFGREMIQKKSGFQEYEWKGADKLVSFKQVKKTGWIVAAGAEQQDMFSSIAAIRNQNIIVAVAMVIFALVLIYWIASKIVRVIHHTVDFSEALRLGDLTKRLKLDRTDEIGQLTNALDEMADSMEKKAILANKIANGDLTENIALTSEKDTLGIALKTMSDSLNDILSQVNEAAVQVGAGSNEVSASSQSLSQGATEQAASLEEITSSMVEMGSQTKTNAENASQANQLATVARSTANKGNDQMVEMTNAMKEINNASQEISKIIKAIDDIAFQTNLLALNAAVEAARAGRYGKGFAVVAEEVRNLASRSATAAKETGDLIETTIKKIEAGSTITDQTASALGDIVDSITKVTDLVGEIAAASNEQAQGISQVNQGLGQIDSVTQQNTANAEETASASEELSAQAYQLQEILKRFRLRSDKRQTTTQAKPSMVKTTATRPAATKPQIAPQKPAKGWGSSPAPTPKGKPALPAGATAAPRKQESEIEIHETLNPKDIISLDDDDFGKY